MSRISRHIFASFVFIFTLVGAFFFVNNRIAEAAACVAPSTDYGKVTQSVNINATGTYRVWTRVKASDTSKNYLLQIDGTTCYTVGSNSLTSGAWTWVDYQTDSTKINHSFTTTGAHTVVMIGNGDGLQVDRVIFTQDGACVPNNTVDSNGLVGENCANPPDTTKPTVGFSGTTPVANATVGGTVAVQASASDDSGIVSKVEVFVDGVSKGNMTLSGGLYNYSWVTNGAGGVIDGPHTIKVVASDGATPANTQEATRTFNVVNGKPDLVVSAIGKSPTTINAGDAVTFNATIKNNGSVAAAPGTILFKIGTTTIGSVVSSTSINPGGIASQTVTLTSPWTAVGGSQTVSVTVDSTNLVNESNESNNTLSQSFTVDVPDTIKPTVSITSPANNAKVSDTVTLTATASDTGGSGVSSVVFYVGTNLLGTGTKSGSTYTLAWNTSSVSNATYSVTAKATDGAGNNTTSSAVSVVVENTTPVEPIPGDMDGDGDVDLVDANKFARYFGIKTGATRGQGDFDGDGDVDLTDFNKFGRYWTGS